MGEQITWGHVPDACGTARRSGFAGRFDHDLTPEWTRNALSGAAKTGARG